MIEELRRVPLFAGLIAQAAGCVPFLKQGVERRLGPGEILAREGDLVEHFYILLEGEMQITKRADGREMVLTSYLPGAFFGEVPLLMDSPFVATCRALTASRVYCLPRDLFWQMIGACPDTRRAILRKMAERVHSLEMHTQRRERLVALGTLSAGFAHELNNPAAAAQRAAGQLRECLDSVLSPPKAALPRLAALRGAARGYARGEGAGDSLARSDREERLGNWLAARGVGGPWEIAPTLAAAGLDDGWLAAHLPAEAVPATVSWLAAVLNADSLLDDVERGTARVSALVEAVKSYSYRDQAPVQEVDLHDGLEATLTMLAGRLEPEAIVLERDYDRALPRLTVYGGELNEVWTSLLDNALDALDGRGHIRVRTACEGGYALVEVRDDGPGIPAEVLPRIFEPFFTTKNIGEGKGLGLDAAYQIIVGHHRGDLRAVSRPGDTRFQVRLPLGGVETA